jgi:hypothetical protein
MVENEVSGASDMHNEVTQADRDCLAEIVSTMDLLSDLTAEHIRRGGYDGDVAILARHRLQSAPPHLQPNNASVESALEPKTSVKGVPPARADVVGAVKRVVTDYFGVSLDQFDTVKRDLAPVEDIALAALRAIASEQEKG